MCGVNATNHKSSVARLALSGAVALGLSGFLALPAAAQTEGADAVLEEILVTAQRREERLEDVPISVSALSGSRLTSMLEGGEDIRALAGRVPGLNAESSNGRVAPRFYLRGLGNTDFDLAASQPVSIIMDEVVMENVILKSFPLFDVERVEVLRGPQGTLFGRNTPAGIIKFDTVKPSEDFDGFARATVGEAGTLNLEAAIGGSLNADDTVMGRVSIFNLNRDDWIDNSFTGESDALGKNEDLAIRAQLLFKPSADFSALVNVHWRDYDGTSEIFRANILTTGSRHLNSNFDRDVVAFDEGDNNPQTAEQTGASIKLDWDFSDTMTLTSITAYETAEDSSLGDIDGGNLNGPGFIPFPSATRDSIDDLKQLTQEFRISSDASDELFWQAGFFYFDDEYEVTTEPFFIPGTTRLHENTAWAVFGQMSLDMTDTLNLTAGVRYTDDEKDLSTPPSSFLGAAPVNVQDDKVSWDVSLLYTMSDTMNVYGRIANGFRGPSIQGRDIAFFGGTSTASSETITSAEVGFKTTLNDGRLRLNGAVFYYQVDDQQITAVGGVGNAIQLVNADKANALGFDLDLEALLTDNFLVQIAVGYNDTEIDDPNLRIATCGSGACTPADPLEDGFALVDGNPLPNAPEWNANIRLQYNIPVSSGEFFVATDWMFQSDMQFLIYDADEFHSGDVFEGGLRAGFAHASGRWDAALFGRNITDEENLKGVIDFNNNTGFVNDRSIWGATFTYHFGAQ